MNNAKSTPTSSAPNDDEDVEMKDEAQGFKEESKIESPDLKPRLKKEDSDSKENAKPTKRKPSNHEKSDKALTGHIDSKKRTRPPSSTPTVKTEQAGEEDDDDEPITKLLRRKADADEKPSGAKAKKTKVQTKKGKNMSPPPPKKAVEEDEEEIDEPAPKKGSRRGSSVSASVSEVEDGLEDEDEDEKPEAAAKAREKVQITLKSKGNDPYPDWKPGEPVPYAALCTAFSLIEMTSKRLVIASHCSLFLRQVLRLTPDDLLSTVLLMINKLAADYAGVELGIGESLIMKAIGETTGRSLAVIKQDQKEIGDLGLVAVKSKSKQPTMFKPKPLTIRGVHKALIDIATMQGNGAQGRKVDGIKKLLSAADGHMTGKVDINKDKGGASEAKFIIRFLEGKLRLGLAEKTVLTSLAQAMVCHELEAKGSNKVPGTEKLAEGEAILKSVHRYVS